MRVTAASQGLLACHACGQLCRSLASGVSCHCPRCGSVVHLRKTDSINRTWALLAAAYILYIPANLLPIMETRSLFGVQEDTIMSGIVYLWLSGSAGLALVVFVASIMVPLLKLLALTLLAASVHFRPTWRPHQRARLFRIVEAVGRWSMLDIFVVALLAALVQIKSLASIMAGPGAAAFGAVVVLTMLASLSFDPRLIWDPISTDVEDEDD